MTPACSRHREHGRWREHRPAVRSRAHAEEAGAFRPSHRRVVAFEACEDFIGGLGGAAADALPDLGANLLQAREARAFSTLQQGKSGPDDFVGARVTAGPDLRADDRSKCSPMA